MLRNLNIMEQLINLLLLAVIVVASILIMTANYYWLGLGIFFVGLLMLIVFRYKASDYLEELLTMYPLILVAIVVGSLTQGWLMGDQRASLIPALDGLVAALPNSYPATLFISVFVGVVAALLLAGILFLLLGLSFVSAVIEDGEIKGKEKDKQTLETVGGPGRVRIYPEQVVVFHKNGKITRAAGLGATLLRRSEKIKAIIPLKNKVDVQEIENVLTKDRIALTLNVAHGAGIELVSGTKKRLEEIKDKAARDENALELLRGEVRQAVQTDELEAIRRHLAEMEAQEEPDQETIDLLKKYKDALEQLEKSRKTVAQLQKIVDSGQTVGDGHNQCYVDIAKLVAAKGPDPWGATRGGVGVNLRDVFMANEFEDLFKIEGEPEDLKAKIDQRKIAEIEKFVLDKVKGGKLGDGIVLAFVDINEVHFPESLHEKLKKVSEARLDEQAAQYEARARVIRARAEAEAKILAGQSEGEARAAFFHELIKELTQHEELRGEELVEAIVELIGRMVSVSDLENLIKETSIPVQRLTSGLVRINGSQK